MNGLIKISTPVIIVKYPDDKNVAINYLSQHLNGFFPGLTIPRNFFQSNKLVVLCYRYHERQFFGNPVNDEFFKYLLKKSNKIVILLHGIFAHYHDDSCDTLYSSKIGIDLENWRFKNKHQLCVLGVTGHDKFNDIQKECLKHFLEN